VLGVPAHPGAIGYGLLLLAVVILGLELPAVRRRARDPAERLAAIAIAVLVAVTPYLAWRVVEDLRTTTAMSAYDRSVAGPVQAYLQPYLLDPVRNIIPPNATYATVVGPGVPYDTAKRAFPSLAMETLFPRLSKSVDDAQWIVAWGATPGSVAHVGHVIVAQRRSGVYPAVLVARVQR